MNIYQTQNYASNVLVDYELIIESIFGSGTWKHEFKFQLMPNFPSILFYKIQQKSFNESH